VGTEEDDEAADGQGGDEIVASGDAIGEEQDGREFFRA